MVNSKFHIMGEDDTWHFVWLGGLTINWGRFWELNQKIEKEKVDIVVEAYIKYRNEVLGPLKLFHLELFWTGQLFLVSIISHLDNLRYCYACHEKDWHEQIGDVEID